MRLIALFGPTGVGKTAVAIALAAQLRERGEDPVAVSADALQVYAGLERLTGAADEQEQAALEHRLLSFVAIDETFSAGRYAQLAHEQIDELLEQGRRPIVVGGTGLYLRAALTDLDLRPPPAPGAREHWMAELERDWSTGPPHRAGAPGAVGDGGDRAERLEADRAGAGAWRSGATGARGGALPAVER